MLTIFHLPLGAVTIRYALEQIPRRPLPRLPPPPCRLPPRLPPCAVVARQ